MTPESRNSPLLDDSLTHILWRCGFVETDLVRNALSMSTESTNYFHGYALDYIWSLAGKNDSIPCGGGAEYLHPNHARGRRRRQGKSRI
jgi:hypothetical protein